MPRRFYSQPLDGAGRRLSSRLRIVAAETAFAHTRLIGKDRQRQIVGQMPADPGVERAKFVLCRLQSQGGAELRLPGGALEEDD